MGITTSKQVYLIGNPNAGKTSIFNALTGLNQKVSNFPGITIDKKQGTCQLDHETTISIIDLPGLYSLYPTSIEEKLVVDILLNRNERSDNEYFVYIADSSQLERHLLLLTQLIDLQLPLMLVLNMDDIVIFNGIKIDSTELSKCLGVSVISSNANNRNSIDALKTAIHSFINTVETPLQILSVTSDLDAYISEAGLNTSPNKYQSSLQFYHSDWTSAINSSQKEKINAIKISTRFSAIRREVDEINKRFAFIQKILSTAITNDSNQITKFTQKVDKIVTNQWLGPILFFGVMFLLFQALYTWASIPMDLIEEFFASSGTFLRNIMGDSLLTDLVVDGVLAGLSGVMVFIPQIAILFFLLAILEETGYMARVVYMFDSVMQRFGMNGRSMVALISSGACAIPAIMSTRTIANQKERLITIMVSPLISCSARLPVYVILIGFAVPSTYMFGIVNVQGLAFMGLYLLGIIGVLISFLVFKYVLKSEQPSFLALEMPNYKKPTWRNVVLSVKEKVGSFVIGAGKVIIVLSMCLWVLASFGPGQGMENAYNRTENEMSTDSSAFENRLAEYRLEESYIGHLGRWIEPAIAPLGYDWKIGIALLTSFAAREVFVGTMATLYSIGSDGEEETLRQKLGEATYPNSTDKVYTQATAVSLLLFYVFAMQCLSTLAVTRKETDSWKWPIIQFTFMSILAYISAFTAYQVLS